MGENTCLFRCRWVIGTELRCTKCFELVTNNSEKCPTCDNGTFNELKIEYMVG